MAVPTMVEIEANGLRFETLLAGPEDGETVILLHGFPQSAGLWRETMEWLGDRGFRAIAPNLRGYSPAANPPEASAYSMDQLVGDVTGIADAQGATRFHVVGHDWGGFLAWALAGAYPERLLSLTVLSTPHGAAMREALRGSTQSLRSLYMRFYRIPRVPEAMLNVAKLTPAGMTVRLFGLPAASWRRDRAQLQRVGGLRGPLNWYRRAVKGPSRGRQPVTVPTMYIWGRRDPFLGRRAAELTAKYVTGPYRFEEISAGHWIVDRNAGDLRRLLGQHLDSHRAPATPSPSPPEAAAPAEAASSDTTRHVVTAPPKPSVESAVEPAAGTSSAAEKRPAARKPATKPKADASASPKPRAKRAPKPPDGGPST